MDRVILMQTDRNYAAPTAVAVYSVLVHAPREQLPAVRIVTQRAEAPFVEQALARVRRQYPEADIRVLPIEAGCFADAQVHDHIRQATYYRLLAPELLPDCDTCLYLDVDLIALGDVTPLFQLDLGEEYLAGVPDIPTGKVLQLNPHGHTRAIGLRDEDPYLNAGVLVMNLDKMRRDGMMQRFLDLVPRNYPLMDQDILNVACAGKIRLLPPEYNVPALYYHTPRLLAKVASPQVQAAAETPVILHFLASCKPWQEWGLKGAEEWFALAREALEGRAAESLYHRLRQAHQERLRPGAATPILRSENYYTSLDARWYAPELQAILRAETGNDDLWRQHGYDGMRALLQTGPYAWLARKYCMDSWILQDMPARHIPQGQKKRGATVKIAIFGTGQYYRTLKEKFFQYQVVALVDNNRDKWHTQVDRVQVIPPAELPQLVCDYIVLTVAPETAQQMEQQCLALGIPQEKLIYCYDFLEAGYPVDKPEARPLLTRSISIEYNAEIPPVQGKRILMLTHEYSYTGAPLVLFYGAKILRRHGYQVTVLSFADGPLREDFLREGIAAGLQSDYRKPDENFAAWMDSFDLVFANTLTYYYWVDHFNRSGTPLILWLHESREAYEWLGPRNMPQQAAAHVQVCCAGPLALRFARQYMPAVSSQLFHYGIPDFTEGKARPEAKPHDKLTLAVIGSVYPRKAQDIVVQAAKLLPKEDWDKARIWIIGGILKQDFYDALCKEMKDPPGVTYLGAFSHDRMEELYQDIDMVVCPSREDPLPVTVTEAMILGKPSIVSTMTGTADLITDREDGLVCETEDPRSLADCLHWVITHPEKLPEMGQKARLLYDRYFSMQVFEDNLCKLVAQGLEKSGKNRKE